MRKVTANINLAAIKHNYLLAKTNHNQTIAVIKANAYGHGAIKVAQYLAETADMFAVCSLQEAIELRDNGIKNPILLLEGLLEKAELKLATELNLDLVISNFAQIEWLKNTTKKLNLFLKYDTGMNRLGFVKNQIDQALIQIKHHNITLMTHFAKADEVNSDFTKQQIYKFNSFAKQFNYPTSLSNSAATLRKITQNETINRAGIMLYGVSPIKDYQDKLLPVMRLTAPITEIKNLAKGDSIGYGATYTCTQECTVGIVAIGYADGYPYHVKNGTPVWVNGVGCKLVGRVSMDMVSVDLTGVKNPKVGDMAELFGENVLINQLAENADTISYEILCKISNRVTKIYQTS